MMSSWPDLIGGAPSASVFWGRTSSCGSISWVKGVKSCRNPLPGEVVRKTTHGVRTEDSGSGHWTRHWIKFHSSLTNRSVIFRT